MPSHQALDPATADVTSLRPQDSMDPGTATMLAALAMDLPDLGQ
ncbi:hypothetical protein [Bradyrhizobium sp. CB3481]|nr:hypothetical protein [Bradyrhizobium sp. CB3481]WFU14539.1 hypothetical protein QA643_25740 [Bradyrhizobium sp. CB3481]